MEEKTNGCDVEDSEEVKKMEEGGERGWRIICVCYFLCHQTNEISVF